MNTLPAEQLASFLREAKESGVYELYYIAPDAGLRRVALVGASLKIKNSYRNIPISEDAVEILKTQKMQQGSTCSRLPTADLSRGIVLEICSTC